MLQDAVPTLGVELGLIDDQRRAVGQRRDDAVGGAGDPSGIGRAPEHVILMQIEHETTGDVVRHRGLMDVHGAFGPARCPAGEVEKRHVFGSGRRAMSNESDAVAMAAERLIVAGGRRS